MGSRSKKKKKKSWGYRRFCDYQDLTDEEKRKRGRERLEKRRASQSRHKAYTQEPLRSVRGLSKRRHKHWGGPHNGTLCMCCFRRAGTHLVRSHCHSRPDGSEYNTYDYACSRCGSESLVFIGSKKRLPRRVASRKAWKKFLEKECYPWLHETHNRVPDDFMKEV